MPHRIAIIEDEAPLAANYQRLFEAEGFLTTVYADADGAREALTASPPDLVLLDIGLGSDREAGFALCRTLRAAQATLPIVFLTARDSEIDIVSGLRLGADDYLTKDISGVQLLARISALLRRVDALRRPEAAEDRLVAGALVMNRERLTVTWHDQPVSLSATEFQMVAALAHRPGHIKSRQQLMDAAGVVLDEATITSHVRRIRSKFEAVDPAFAHIETAYGLGYRWRGDA